MSVQSCPSLLSLSLAVPEQPPAARLLAVSFTLHLCLLALMLSVRISATRELSVDSYQVALVSMPIPVETVQPRPKLPIEAPKPLPIKQVPPVPSTAQSPDQPKQPSPAATAPEEPDVPPPVQERVPTPAAPPERPAPVVQPIAPIQAVEVPKRQKAPERRDPMARTSTAPSPTPFQRVEVPQRRRIPPPADLPEARPREPQVTPQPEVPIFRGTYEAEKQFSSQLRDALGGIKQLPEAPKLSTIAPSTSKPPARRTDTARPRVSKILKDLPEVPTVSLLPQTPSMSKQGRQPTRSATPDITDRLRRLEQARSEPRPSTEVPEASKATPVERPQTQIQVFGASSALDQYLALIRSKISGLWVAPPVDITGRTFRVVIGFRLHRDGSISEIVVERTSGNGYYDDAGKRAVQAADPLPQFPQSFSESALDAHFSFTVGSGAG